MNSGFDPRKTLRAYNKFSHFKACVFTKIVYSLAEAMDLFREAFCARASTRCQAAEVGTRNRGNSEGGCGSASRTRNCNIYIIVLHKKRKWTERKT